MASTPITISVIIPTCHRNELLAKCLDCLAPDVQTLPTDQYEVIITDDGSKSTAEKMVREQYSWARWVEGPKKGPAANRNNGAKFAQGEWLAFTDDDCLPDSDWLKSYANAITDDKVVYEGKVTCLTGIHSPLYVAPINSIGGLLWSCNMMIKKVIFVETKGFDEDYLFAAMEDVDFRERLKSCHNIYSKFVQDAIVDHPPRRRPSPIKLALMHECQVIFWGKSRRKPPSLFSHISYTIVFNLRQIANTKLSGDSILSLFYLMVEVVVVAWHMRTWKEKYLF